MKKKELLALINELSRRVAVLEGRQPVAPIVLGPKPPVFGVKCLVCGEYHTSTGLPCPKTATWAGARTEAGKFND